MPDSTNAPAAIEVPLPAGAAAPQKESMMTRIKNKLICCKEKDRSKITSLKREVEMVNSFLALATVRSTVVLLLGRA